MIFRAINHERERDGERDGERERGRKRGREIYLNLQGLHSTWQSSKQDAQEEKSAVISCSQNVSVMWRKYHYIELFISILSFLPSCKSCLKVRTVTTMFKYSTTFT